MAPLERSNIDTDQIIPKQYLKRVKKTGYGDFLFSEWRYLDSDEPDPDFILNQSPYDRASILLTRENFGCGSSREHAAWALRDFGIKTIIAPSFADIFYNNAFKNGLLPISLIKEEVNHLFKVTDKKEEYRLTVKLAEQEIVDSQGRVINFELDNTRKKMLLEGLDQIDLTLQHEDKISTYEASNKAPTSLA